MKTLDKTQAGHSAPWRSAAFIYPYRREVPMYSFFPPVGLEYVASCASEVVPRVEIFDLRYERNSLPSLSIFDAVCVSINWKYEYEEVCRFIENLPGTSPVIVGGRTAGERASEILTALPRVSAVVCGDGHDAVRELAAGMPYERIAGLLWRSNGRLVSNPGRGHSSITQLRYPDRSLRRQNYTVALEGKSFGIPFDVIMTSWGCPFRCKFCALRLDAYGRRRPWSARSPESVVEELSQVKSRWVGIIDENFFVDIGRAEKICDLIIKERVRKVIGVQARVSVTRYPGLLRKMWRAGFRVLSFGIESAHDSSLELMDKRITVSEIQSAFRTLKDFAFLTNGYFIVGNIGETKSEILDILPFARSLGLDFMTLNILHMEENSGLAELVESHPGYRVARDGTIYSDHCPGGELREVRKAMDRKFYSPLHVLETFRRAFAAGLLDFGQLVRAAPPALAYSVRKIAKKARKRSFRNRRRLQKLRTIHAQQESS